MRSKNQKTITLKQARIYAKRQQADKRAARKAAAFNFALRHFRPRKKEFGKFVFVGMRGGRPRPSEKRKAFALYVSKNGKISPVVSHKDGLPFARIPANFDLFSTRFKKAARKSVSKPIRKKSYHKEGKDINLWSALADVADILQHIGRTPRWQLDFYFEFYARRQKRSGSFQVAFVRSESEKFSSDGYRHFTQGVCYRRIADAMSMYEAMTSQSAKAIKRMKKSKKKKKGARINKDGYTKARVTLLDVDFNIVKLQENENEETESD